MPEQIKINNNITLHYIPMTKLKTSTLSVFIHRPLNEEESSYNALLPYVLKRGCKLCPSIKETAKYLEELYGASLYASVTKRGEDHVMYFYGETISDKYTPDNEPLTERLTSLMMSVLFEPKVNDDAFNDEVIAQEKNNAVNRINALINDKRSYASIRCQTEMCRGENFAVSRLGSVDGINSITPASLYKHYKKIITSSVIDFYICGEADIEKVADKIRSYISSMNFTAASIPTTCLLKKDSPQQNINEKLNVTQGKLAIGFRTSTSINDTDMPAMQVFNSIFGSGAHSKLFNNVREKLSLAYYASSQLDKFKGLCIVNAGIEFENYQKALDETLVQLEDIKAGKISDLEFDSSINAIVNSYNSYLDDQFSLQLYYLDEEIAGTDMDISQRIDAIKSVTKNDVMHAAQKLKLDTVYFLTGKENE